MPVFYFLFDFLGFFQYNINMSRQLRIEYPGEYYHFRSQGVIDLCLYKNPDNFMKLLNKVEEN